jgi:hypothetical protein
MKLTLKQKRAGVVNVYEVKLTVQIHHQSEKDAQEYLFTTLENWSRDGEVITGVQFDSVVESPKRFFVSVAYPEYFDPSEEV